MQAWQKYNKKVKTLMEQRAILCTADSFDMQLSGESEQPEPVQSPIADGLINLYSQSDPAPQGVILRNVRSSRPGKDVRCEVFPGAFLCIPWRGECEGIYAYRSRS